TGTLEMVADGRDGRHRDFQVPSIIQDPLDLLVAEVSLESESNDSFPYVNAKSFPVQCETG
ncbi:MAG: hypothetical protein ACTSUK_09880, partial [Promethearchaeota archaeon]